MIGMIAAGVAGLCALLALWRFLLGPSLYDRALAAHAVVAMMALACSGLGAASGAPQWIDVAIALLLALFVFDVALLKLVRLKSFQPPFGGRGEVRR